ncbi:MAG: sulfotransferase [Alphaproteobacteria bacterium]|nr:sulfotransferase [Alphaproteobacteria bacterium]
MSEADEIVDAGRAAHRRGAIQQAAEQYRRALGLDPNHAMALAGLGVVALQSGTPAEAGTYLQRAAQLAPENPTIQNNLGNVLIATGDAAGAEAAFNAALAADPTLIDALYNRAVARHHLRRRNEAEADYRAVLKQDPGRIDAAINLAAVLRETENLPDAIAVLEDALSTAPPHPDAILSLATLYETVGRAGEAASVLDQLPPDRQADPQAILVRARLALRRGEAEAGLSCLEELSGEAPPSALRQAAYIRGLLLDRQGRHAEAFDAFSHANSLMRAGRPDADTLAGRYRDRIAAYRKAIPTLAQEVARLSSAPTAPLPFDLVFFCGFPRSGTTLMEQILAAHPDTGTTGEDSPLHRLYESFPMDGADAMPFALLSGVSIDQREALRRAFVDLVKKQLGTCDGRTVIDKLPLNLVELGIIELLFPEARILVAIRDPRDCVLSAFMQPFRLNEAMACLLTPGDAAQTYIDVFDLYQEQKARSALAIAEYRYEDLVRDFDGTLRGVIEFLGLSWTEDLARYRDRLAGKYISTPSYMAVSQSLNTRAIGRWRNYESVLGDTLDRLAPMAARHGYT